MSNPIGRSLHVGINYLNKSGYPIKQPNPDFPDGWDGPLNACVRDAEAMQAIANSKRFETDILRNEDATAENVLNRVQMASETLSAGDIFFLSYAGHGGQVLDRNSDEVDKLDETWCLYDRQFLDDEQEAMYAEFKPGVRILVLSDSCHSGSVSRGGPQSRRAAGAPASRAMPTEWMFDLYNARKAEYDEIQDRLQQAGSPRGKNRVRLISACKDNQEALDGVVNGRFTTAVLDAWAGGRFDGDHSGNFHGTYKEFYDAIALDLQTIYEREVQARASGEIDYKPKAQTPRFFPLDSLPIDAETPFSI